MTRWMGGLLLLLVVGLSVGCARAAELPVATATSPPATATLIPTATEPLPTPVGTLRPVAVAADLEPGDTIGGMTLGINRSGAAEIWDYCDAAISSPGVTAKACEVPWAPTLFVGYGIAAKSAEELSTLWGSISWTLEIDGRPVDLPAFGTFEQEIKTAEPVTVRMHNVALHPPVAGAHTLRYVIAQAGGTFDITWTFTVVGQAAYPTFSAAALSAGQHPYTSTVAGLPFLLYLPEAYGTDPDAQWPLLLYLHGSGERGSDLRVLRQQPLPETLAYQSDFPFIVVSPQLSLQQYSWIQVSDALIALLNELAGTLAVDPQRISVTGLSLGGIGTWQLGLAYPERFAALVPIAGVYLENDTAAPQAICDLTDVPVWAFHGAEDSTVPLDGAERVVQAFEACGGAGFFTVYDDAGHEETWRRAYADPALVEWLLEQKRE